MLRLPEKSIILTISKSCLCGDVNSEWEWEGWQAFQESFWQKLWLKVWIKEIRQSYMHPLCWLKPVLSWSGGLSHYQPLFLLIQRRQGYKGENKLAEFTLCLLLKHSYPSHRFSHSNKTKYRHQWGFPSSTVLRSTSFNPEGSGLSPQVSFSKTSELEHQPHNYNTAGLSSAISCKTQPYRYNRVIFMLHSRTVSFLKVFHAAGACTSQLSTILTDRPGELAVRCCWRGSVTPVCLPQGKILNLN